MEIGDLLEHWSKQKLNAARQWVHPDDEHALTSRPHSFNLDYPLGPFVGDLQRARVIVLGANGGFNAERTPREFSRTGWREEYLSRMRDPSAHDWRVVDEYYRARNYYRFLGEGSLVLVNACAYRSPKISEEPENARIAASLPSVRQTKRWLLAAVLPLAAKGERLVVVKRARLRNLDAATRLSPGLVVDQHQRFPNITAEAWEKVCAFLG